MPYTGAPRPQCGRRNSDTQTSLPFRIYFFLLPCFYLAPYTAGLQAGSAIYNPRPRPGAGGAAAAQKSQQNNSGIQPDFV